MKIILAPDKFKGSLTSFEVCAAIERGIKNSNPSAEILSFPMADGGDGFASILQYYYQTKTIDCNTVDPLNRNIKASWQWQQQTKTAIIEMAVASGLVLLTHEERNALKTSTYGTGLLIKDAIGKGAEKIILGLGGSATNDAGIGILAALGFHFLNSENNELSPTGENLLFIKRIIAPHVLPNITIEIACDVQNTLHGPQGAAYIYAPQKGADENAVKLLDDGLKNFASVIKTETGKDIASVAGTGAAGGIAAGLMAFFNVTMRRGTDLLIEASGMMNALAGADLVITGEGKMDQQTLEGKVVHKIAGLANERAIPLIAFCGVAEEKELLQTNLNIIHIESLVSEKVSREEAMQHAARILAETTAIVYTDIIAPLFTQ